MRFGIWPSLVLMHGTGCIFSAMRVEAEETVFMIEADSVFYEIRDEAEERVFIFGLCCMRYVMRPMKWF